MEVGERRTLWTLYAINFLNAVGMWFFLPLLPIFLGRKGGSAALVGVVFAAGLVANAVVRYPAGWAADRFGTKAGLIAAMLATAALFLTYRGATTFLVGLSFVTFALPAMLLGGYAGSLGDRFGARRFIVAALICTAFFAALYPFIASVPWLIGLGLIEGMFTISGLPSMMAEVSRLAEPGQYARTQAVFQTAQTAVQIAGALAGGALFTLSPTYTFLSIAAVCVLSAGTALVPRATFARMAHQAP